MKKVLATVMAVAMLVSVMTVSAGATYKNDSKHLTSDDAGNLSNAGTVSTGKAAGDTIGTADVPVTFQIGTGGDITHVYALSFTPEKLTFTYGTGVSYIWDPETQKYEMRDAGTTPWTANANTITVTNYSDLSVEVSAAFVKDAGVTADITTTITAAVDAANGTTDGTVLHLNSAVADDATTEATGTPHPGTFKFAVDGTLYAGRVPGQDYKLGTITLTVKVPTA